MKYVYECCGKIKELKDQETKVENGQYFVVICHECCNVPVCHLLERGQLAEIPDVDADWFEK